nr:MAG TPA: hypothetical protein [Caudoviricetes sp.]
MTHSRPRSVQQSELQKWPLHTIPLLSRHP